MKRCKAVTSRACDAIECTLLAEHEGAHEGQRDKDTRAVWTNPDAPEYLPLEGAPLPGSAQAHAVERDASHAAFEALMVTGAVTLVVPEEKRPQTHCPCGAEHDQKLDPTLRTMAELPVIAMNDGVFKPQPDERFAWPRVCRECGLVYCQRWDFWKR